MPALLELFSGTGSVGRAFAARGWEVVSVDRVGKFEPTHCVDVLAWDFSAAYPPGHFDVVWASPPCVQYSCARTRGPPRDLEGADRLVAKALEIIDHFGPRWFWVENPATGLLKTRPVVQPLGAPYTASYCHYGFRYRKHTHLWSNCPHFRPRVCNKRCFWYKDKRHLASAQCGPNKGDLVRNFTTEFLYKIPGPLCDDIAEASARSSSE